MKSHMLLMRSILDESGIRCCTSTSRDWKTITTRVESEGLSFLTITLPQFAVDLQKGLDISGVSPSFFAGFAKKGCLPRFLLGFTGRIFDPQTGCLLDEPCIESIHAVRQICLAFSKVNLPCSDARVKKALKGYVECEQQVRLNDQSLSYADISAFKTMAVKIWEPVLSIVDRDIYDGVIVPKHGPGSTADKLRGNAKFEQHTWTERLEYYFPHGEYIFSSWSHFLDSPDVPLLDPGSEIPVKVITVPKTLKTPRIIAVEPTCMQYVQQGILECLVGSIEHNLLLNSFVGFSDQIPNQDLARKGSIDGSLATLDLSEASDRVSNQLVRYLFCYFPHANDGIDACRSRKADVPGFGVQRLAKFASMGSALCFPIEAMVFFTVILLGIQDELRRPLTIRDLLDLQGKVRVYGDDIIVPVEYVRSVVSKLQTFGFVVNANKSFWTGKFRESCGKEYYDGHDVSVVKVREVLPTQRRHVPEIVSTVSLRNQLYFAGYWKTCQMLDELLGRLIPFPMILPTSPGLGRHSFLGYTAEKECPHLQRPLVKAAVVRATIPKSNLEGHGALLKWFLKRGDEPFADRNHLERAGRPDAVNIKLRWVSAI